MRLLFVAALACNAVGCSLEEFADGASSGSENGGAGGAGGSGPVDASSTSTGGGSGGTKTCAATYDFDDGILPAPLGMVEDADVSVALQDNGVLVAIADSASAGARGEIETIVPGDMSACSASVHAVPLSAGGQAQSVHLMVRAGGDPGQYVAVVIVVGTLYAVESSSARPTLLAESVVQPFFRIRMAGGTTSWQTSRNAVEWSEIATAPTPTWSTSAHVGFGAIGPGMAAFDDLILVAE